MTRDLNERKNVFESGGFSQQFKSSCGHTATDAATKCVLTYFAFFSRYFRAKNPTIKERTLKGQINSLIFIYSTLITHFN